MKKRLKAICILFIIFVIFYIFRIYGMSMLCLFKGTFNISCPSCGMTRSFNSILDLNFIEAFKLNILAIPLAILIIISIITLVLDIIFARDKFIQNIKKFFNNYYILIILSLVLSMVYNNVMKI